MKPVLKKNKQSKRVMQAMITISLAIHILIFMHIAGIYHSEALTYIELSMQDISRPSNRVIPHPRHMHQAPKVSEVKKIDVQKELLPQINTVETSSLETLSDPIAEQITMPDVTDWQSAIEGSGQYLTKQDYIDMLRLKIESRRKYPKSARDSQIQGRVLVGFTLNPDGGIISTEIIKSSRHPALDQAALNAVKTAAPFPRPPANLFSGPLKMKIAIMFELT